MSYPQLYEAWKQEKESSQLQPLERHFYTKLSAYIKGLREVLRILEEKSLRARLISEESERVERLLTDLTRSRLMKMFNNLQDGRKIPAGYLTPEEEDGYTALSEAFKSVRGVTRSILRGKPPRSSIDRTEEKPKRILVRFIKAIPAIIGPNMNTYGPFKEEDVASLPAENAKVLINRGVAVEV